MQWKYFAYKHYHIIIIILSSLANQVCFSSSSSSFFNSIWFGHPKFVIIFIVIWSRTKNKLFSVFLLFVCFLKKKFFSKGIHCTIQQTNNNKGFFYNNLNNEQKKKIQILSLKKIEWIKILCFEKFSLFFLFSWFDILND